MRPEIKHVLQFFEFGHLPSNLQKISSPFHTLAVQVGNRADNLETVEALRHLLSAKDAAVRAAVLEYGLVAPPGNIVNTDPMVTGFQELVDESVKNPGVEQSNG